MLFSRMLCSRNIRRIAIEMTASGKSIDFGRDALGRASRYAKDRVVFQRPIGQNQSIQHPLAVNWAELEAAFLMAMKAAWLYDTGRPCGLEANAAKYLAAEAGFNACKQAVMTHGGMGYAREFHVEVRVEDEVVGRGVGGSKREAEQQAARQALENLAEP